MAKTPTENKKSVQEPRKLKASAYKSFRLQKRVKTDQATLPGSFKILKGSLGVLRRNWKVFGGIVLIYGLLNILLVQSFNGGDLDNTKTMLDGLNTGQLGQIASALALFVYMAGASGNTTSDVAGAYQLALSVTVSLAIIWTLRQAYAQKKVRIRDSFYRGMYPLVPFLLVLLVVTIQLAPIIIGGFLYNLVRTNGIAVGGAEVILWGFLFFLLALLTLYMLCSSLLALYIVCLQDMQPMAALRAARDLVRYRRWTIMRRIIFLPVFLLVGAIVLIIPAIFLATPVAGVLFFLLSMAGLPIIHSYMYRLYRELL